MCSSSGTSSGMVVSILTSRTCKTTQPTTSRHLTSGEIARHGSEKRGTPAPEGIIKVSHASRASACALHRPMPHHGPTSRCTELTRDEGSTASTSSTPSIWRTTCMTPAPLAMTVMVMRERPGRSVGDLALEGVGKVGEGKVGQGRSSAARVGQGRPGQVKSSQSRPGGRKTARIHCASTTASPLPATYTESDLML